MEENYNMFQYGGNKNKEVYILFWKLKYKNTILLKTCDTIKNKVIIIIILILKIQVNKILSLKFCYHPQYK